MYINSFLAVAEGLADVVEALIRLSPNTELISIQNNQGYSPLHIAVLKNQPLFVRRLVVAGARLDLRDGEGNSALHLTARRGYVECAEALLKPVAVHEVGHGQRVPHNQQIDILDQRNTNGEHCVHLATMGGHITFLQFLSWNNADMDALGMVSHKMSLITNFDLKHKIKYMIKKFDIFHEKISMTFGFWSIFGIKFLILKQKYFKND